MGMARCENDLKLMGIKILQKMSDKNISSIKELESKTEISRTTLSKLINGKSNTASYRTIIKLCRVLDCDVNELIEMKGDFDELS